MPTCGCACTYHNDIARIKIPGWAKQRARTAITMFINKNGSENADTQAPEHNSYNYDTIVAEQDVKQTKGLDQFH